MSSEQQSSQLHYIIYLQDFAIYIVATKIMKFRVKFNLSYETSAADKLCKVVQNLLVKFHTGLLFLYPLWNS